LKVERIAEDLLCKKRFFAKYRDVRTGLYNSIDKTGRFPKEGYGSKRALLPMMMMMMMVVIRIILQKLYIVTSIRKAGILEAALFTRQRIAFTQQRMGWKSSVTM
jgi:hypothetical protein